MVDIRMISNNVFLVFLEIVMMESLLIGNGFGVVGIFVVVEFVFNMLCL